MENKNPLNTIIYIETYEKYWNTKIGLYQDLTFNGYKKTGKNLQIHKKYFKSC